MRDALVRRGAGELGIALAVLDGDGTVLEATEPWVSLDTAGTVPAAAAVGESYPSACEAITDDDTAAATRERFNRLLSGGTGRVETEYSLPRSEDLPRRFRLRGRRITDADPHVVVEHTEWSEQSRREREQAHCRDTLADLATVVSHDIRSPLTAALSWAELLDADPDTDTEKLDRVVSGLERTNAIADASVTLARETGVDRVESVSVGAVATHVWETVDSDGAELSVEAGDPVLADEHSLEVILESLLRNAVQHGTREEGVERADLTVRVGPLEDGFYVEDSGAGVEEGVRDNLFEVGVTTSAQNNSTGIGLAVVERAAQAHGWTVGSTDAETGGARFEITGVRRPA